MEYDSTKTLNTKMLHDVGKIIDKTGKILS